jgi:hypothetical protein
MIPRSFQSTLLADPFFTTVFSDSDFSVIRFPSGLIASCLTHDLNRTRTMHLSPDAPASRPFRRHPTPRYVPDSPPQESSSSPEPAHADITYDLSRVAIRSSNSSVSPPNHRPPLPPLPHLGLPRTQWGDGPQ